MDRAQPQRNRQPAAPRVNPSAPPRQQPEPPMQQQPDQPLEDREEPPCECSIPSVIRTVRKEGPNCGRQFYTCSKPQTDSGRCEYFQVFMIACLNI